MADRRVKVVFSAEVQNYKSSMEAAAKTTESLKKASDDAGKATEQLGAKSEAAAKAAAEAAKKHKDAVENVGTVATVAGAAVLAGVGLAVKSYADFDKQMSSVDAATHETAGNMGLLREAAIKAGADTAFSASEAARGIEQMAKAGVSTKDILGGGLTGALSLAAAGSLDVGKAAEIASSAMTQFKLSGDKLPHVADLLAAGAGKAQGSVEDLGAALNQSGLVASQTGLTIEETTGGLAAFASAGLIGSDAGTSFKSMLQRLNPQSEEASKLMKDLGLSAYDSQGNFIGLSEYAGELQKALGGMTTEQRNATLSTLFGSDAIRAASVLYENGAVGVQKWENAVNDAGYAAETAARMQDNLAGDLEKLGGSFDTVLIQSGSGANDVLRGLVQGLEGLVDTVGKVPGPVLAVGTGLAAVVGGAGLLAGGLITVIPKIQATREALELLAPAGSKVNGALSKTGKIAAGAATGLAAVAAASALAQPALEKIYKPTGETGDALEAFGGQAAKGAVGADTLNKSFQDLIQSRDGVGAFQTAIEGIADPGFWGNVDNVLVGIGNVGSLGMANLTSTSERARERMKALGEQLASLDAGKAAASFQDMAKATNGSDEQLRQLLDLMPAYRKTLEDQAKATGNATDDQTLLDIAMGKIPASTDAAKAAIEKQGAAAETAAQQNEEVKKALEEIGIAGDGTILSLEKLTGAMQATGLISISADQAAINYQKSLEKVDEMVAKNGKTLDIHTAAGKENKEAWLSQASAANAATEANAKNGMSSADLQVGLSAQYYSLRDNALAFGASATEADSMARAALGIPKDVKIETAIQNYADTMAKAAAIKKAVDDINPVKTIFFQTDASGFYDPSAGTDGKGAGSGGKSKGPGAYATGGRLTGFADGGQLPTSGPGTNTTDGFLGISSAGVPLARVDAGEWIVNRNSSGRYNRELAAINAGTFPKLPGYATGGMFAAGSSRQGGSGLDAASVRAIVRAVNMQRPIQVNGVRDPYAAAVATARLLEG